MCSVGQHYFILKLEESEGIYNVYLILKLVDNLFFANGGDIFKMQHKRCFPVFNDELHEPASYGTISVCVCVCMCKCMCVKHVCLSVRQCMS